MTLSRRHVLTHGAALTAAAALPAEAEAQTVLLRRNVSSLAPDHAILVSYRKAINAMKALPQSDPRNWTRQAQIHQGSNVVRCPHNNWYFLPWHRAYLLAFERICRQLSGNANFALPYWDWTSSPQLPAAFATPTFNGQPNALFDNTRSSQTVTIPTNIAGSTVMANIYSETTFEIFGSAKPAAQNNTNQQWQIAGAPSGPLESGPHNSVHGRIGGNMGTYMSPLDPIFWLHHCNIDRIWDQWNRLGRANTSNVLWRNFPFNNQFSVPSGNATAPYNVAVSGLLNIQQARLSLRNSDLSPVAAAGRQEDHRPQQDHADRQGRGARAGEDQRGARRQREAECSASRDAEEDPAAHASDRSREGPGGGAGGGPGSDSRLHPRRRAAGEWQRRGAGIREPPGSQTGHLAAGPALCGIVHILRRRK